MNQNLCNKSNHLFFPSCASHHQSCSCVSQEDFVFGMPQTVHLPRPEGNPLRRYLHGAKGRAPFALITGATGGMGEEWAYQLAHHGFNVIIQGRNRKKLETVRDTIVSRQIEKGTPKRRKSVKKKEEVMEDGKSPSSTLRRTRKGSLKRKRSNDQIDVSSNTSPTFLPVPAHVQVEILVCEATPYPNVELLTGLDSILSKKDVRLTMVINNLGVQSEGYPKLEELSHEEMAGIVIANSLFPAEVSRKCLPHLKKHQPSLLITVTSIGAWTPTPYLSPYMGTKGFDVAFSHSLRSEMLCEDEQVDIVCMVPGQVQSGMCAEPESLMVPTSFDWVRSAVSSLRPGGSLANILPYNWLAPPAFQPSSSSKNQSPSPSSYWTRPKGVITPWWPHYAGMLVAQYGPTWLLDSVAVKTVKGLKRKHDEMDEKVK